MKLNAPFEIFAVVSFFMFEKLATVVFESFLRVSHWVDEIAISLMSSIAAIPTSAVVDVLPSESVVLVPIEIWSFALVS